MDVKPRPCANPAYPGKSFGSNAAAWWGFHYKELMTDPNRARYHDLRNRCHRPAQLGQGGLQFPWTPQTDPFGVVHKTIDYPGVPVDHARSGEPRHPEERAHPDPAAFRRDGRRAQGSGLSSISIPPSYFGGNMDNWRVGKGATMYYPIAVQGGLFSIGDSHASQGDSELCGTAIEMSLTGTFQLILHKQETLTGSLAELNYPLLETQDEWVMHGFSFANYLAELGPTAQSEIYKKSSIDLALRDAFRKMRSFLMTTKGLSEDEAISLMSIGVDFGVTQVVDGNWGIHAIIKKSLFAGTATA